MYAWSYPCSNDKMCLIDSHFALRHMFLARQTLISCLLPNLGTLSSNVRLPSHQLGHPHMFDSQVRNRATLYLSLFFCSTWICLGKLHQLPESLVVDRLIKLVDIVLTINRLENAKFKESASPEQGALYLDTIQSSYIIIVFLDNYYVPMGK